MAAKVIPFHIPANFKPIRTWFQHFLIEKGRLLAFKLTKSMVAMALLGTLLGCAEKRPPAYMRHFQNIEFRDCKIRDQRDGKNVCECKVVEWIQDAKLGNWIAVCLP